MPGQNAPSGAFITNVDDLEKAFYDNDSTGVHIQLVKDPELGRLIRQKDNQCGQVETKVCQWVSVDF